MIIFYHYKFNVLIIIIILILIKITDFNEIYPDKEMLGWMNAVSFLQPKCLKEYIPYMHGGNASLIISLFCFM